MKIYKLTSEENIDIETPEDSLEQTGENVDEKYMRLAENPEENREELQRMVDEAAKKAGYNIKAYHGTQKDFDQFRIDDITEYKRHQPELTRSSRFASMFTTDPSYASKYGDNVVSVWLRSNNPKREDQTVVQGAPFNFRATLTQPIVEQGYDAIYFGSEDIENAKEIAIFSPSQVKSAEPVTYDENGNIVPLSERFNTERPEIFAHKKSRTKIYRLAQKLFHGGTAISEVGDDSIIWLSSNPRVAGVNAMSAPKWFQREQFVKEIDEQSPEMQEILRKNYLKPSGVQEVTVNLDNPFIVDAQGNSWLDIPIPEAMQDDVVGDVVDTNAIAEWAREHGYDGAIVRNVLEGKGALVEADTYAVFDKNKIAVKNENI